MLSAQRLREIIEEEIAMHARFNRTFVVEPVRLADKIARGIEEALQQEQKPPQFISEGEKIRRAAGDAALQFGLEDCH